MVFLYSVIFADENGFMSLIQALDAGLILYYEHLRGKKEYSHRWRLVERLLLLSHGQATVERGFSVNKQCTAENLLKKSLKGKRLRQLQRQGGCATWRLVHLCCQRHPMFVCLFVRGLKSLFNVQ